MLSSAEFDVVCAAEGRTDRRALVLDVPSPGTTGAERAHLVAQVWSELRARGLAEPGRDRAAPDLADLLAALDRPHRSVDVRIWADRPIRAQAAAGAAAVLAIVDTDLVELHPIRPGGLVEAAVSVAGDAAAGAGRSVSLPNEHLREAGRLVGPDDPQELGYELRALGVAPDDAVDVANMVSGMGMRGQFGAQMADRRGGRAERARGVVGFHDTPGGRYLHVLRGAADRREWSTVAPADNARIAEYVIELFDVLDRG
ncbi:ESX secretion-associated protein EspG [Saccharopolyspora sp. HNM0983]|uniref:ESX secretion-associated protein EspG n=1 Tax=Saccharopolyspora montiporae TaxID=2781240 RepID=A0A929B712_9PSEU|nr:ESX secretion-associated protein EspG [Saccharopolyspora sp. HNM0983]